MSDVSKITDRIRKEAEEEVKTLETETAASLQSISDDYTRRTNEECDRIAKKAESNAEGIKQRSVDSAALKTKQILLAGRQELISDTIREAKEALLSLSGEEYSNMIKDLFAKHMPTKDATIRFGKNDLSKITEATINDLVKCAADNNVKLTVSREDADINNGFILDFGGIDENCSIDALFDQKTEELQDKVKAILFA